jgi:putative ABC transport system permease protein
MSDVKHALRVFAKSPGFTATLLAMLALGIGANTAVFSIVESVLLRPLPYRDPARLINILDASTREQQLAKIFSSYTDFEEFSRHARSLNQLAATSWAGRPDAILTGRGPAKGYLTLPVTADFFATLGVSPQRGRTFTADDLRAGCEVVLSDKFWRGALHADPAIVGQSLSLDDRSCIVLGIMPSAFAFYPPETQIWSLLLPGDPRLRTYFGVFMVARLRPGVTPAQAQSELTALHTALHAHDSNGEKEFTPLVDGLQDQFTWLAGRNLRTTLAILFAAVFAVLSIACLNVANLLLGRSLARNREFAIRAALGSGRARLLRQLLTEAALLCFAAGALGLLLAFAAIRYFARVQPIELPVGSTISLSLPALAFTAAVSMLTAVVFGIVPGLTLSRGNVQAGLRATGPGAAPGSQRLSRLLVAAEMALSVILLASASLLLRSVLSFGSAPLGFAVDGVVAANGSLPPQRYPEAERKAAFYDQLQRRLAGLPGIASAALASTLPPYGLGLSAIEIQGKPVPPDARRHDVGEAAVAPDYFSVFEVPLRRGRVFTSQDLPRSDQVAIVNEELAREYFPDQDPLGRQIRVDDVPQRAWLTIVGIVGNERRPTVFHEMSWIEQPALYRPLSQNPRIDFSIAVRGAARPSGLGHTIEQAVASVDPEAAVGEVQSMRSRLAPYLKYPQFRAVVLAAFSALAILHAAIGLYGVLAQFVAQRTREIGVRMALGAEGRNIVALVAKKGGLPVFAGLLLGLASSLALTRSLSNLLYGVSPDDPLTFAAVVLVMFAAASLAMIVPARRASRVDPMIALRSE